MGTLVTRLLLLLTLSAMTAVAQVGVQNNAFTAIPSSNDAATGQVGFQELESNGTDLVGFRAPASVTTEVIWTLPDADGTSNQAMCTDAAGTLTWCSPAFTDVENEFTEKNIFSKAGGALLLGRNTEVLNFTSSIMTVVSNSTKLSLRAVGGGPAFAMWKDEAAGGGGPTIAAAIGLSIPGVAAGNNLVLSTFATGGSWNERFTVENDGDIAIDVGHHYMANNTKLFFEDTAATPINTFWLDGSNFLNIGTIDAITGRGDLIFYRDGGAEFKLAWSTADSEGYLGPAVDRTNNFGATDALWDESHIEEMFLGRGTSTTEVQGQLHLYTGVTAFSLPVSLRGAAIGLVKVLSLELAGGPFIPLSDGTQKLGMDDGTVSRRWDGFFDDIDVSGTCTGCGDPPFIDWTGSVNALLEDDADATKNLAIQISAIPTATTRVWTAQNTNLTVAGIDVAQPWSADQTYDNDIKVNWEDSLGAVSTLLWLDGSNFVNFGTVNAVNGRGDIIFYRDGGAEAKLTWSTADTEGYFGPATDRVNNFGATDALWDEGHIETLSLGRPTSTTEVQGELHIYNGVAAFSAMSLRGRAVGSPILTATLELAGGSFIPLSDGAQNMGYDDGVVSRRWDGFFDTMDIVDIITDLTFDAHNTYDVGEASVLVRDTYSTDFHAGKPTSTALQGRVLFANTDTTATTTAVFQGIVKNAGTAAEIAAIEVSNFSISSSGSFYLRPVSGGDISCTNIDDGWFAMATTPNELQGCDGAAVFITPYIAVSFAPITVNCTAGQSLEDPRFENGILVEGTCVTR